MLFLGKRGISKTVNKVAVIITLVSLSLLAIFYTPKSNNPSIQTKEKACPDKWIDNQMPSVGDKPNQEQRQYFIVDGERRELSEFDLQWVLENCDIRPQVVY